MIQIRPISDLRNKFTEIEKEVSGGNPVYLTKNGYGSMVVLSIEAYSKLVDGDKDDSYEQDEPDIKSLKNKKKMNVREGVLLESKNVIEDYATDAFNYGSQYAVFTVGEKGEKLRKKICEYILVFKDGAERLEFKVDKNIYSRMEEGTVGNLTYRKNEFISFDVI